MPATRDGKLWRSQFYYKDWQGVRRKKNKRGFKTKGEADEWERNFLQQQQKNLDISFENFVEIYFADMENRLRESTIINKRYVFDLKVTPYFKHKKMCEIQTSDIRAWQNELIKKGYAPTYLKSINNQLAALFNYAVRYYDLRDNPCRKAGSIGKSKADEMDFWTKQEFKVSCPMWQEGLIISPIRNDRNISIRPIRQKEQHRSFGKILQEKISWILRRVDRQGNASKGVSSS